MGLTKATYAMINGSPINVLDYGAVGDGLTDDTAAFTAAATYCNDNNKTLYVPDGTYVLTNTITVNNIVGNGNTSIIKNKTGFSGTCLIQSTTTKTVLFNLQNLAFEVTEAITAVKVTKDWTAEAYSNVNIDNVYVKSKHKDANGIYLKGCREGVVSNIFLYANDVEYVVGTGKGLWISGDSTGGAMNIQYVNLQIEYWNYGIYAVSPNTTLTEGHLFSSLVIIGCIQPIWAENIFHMSFSNVMIDNNVHGSFFNNVRPLLISEGYLHTADSAGDQPCVNVYFTNLSQSDGVVITNCKISNSSNNALGINVNATNSNIYGIVIENNFFTNTNRAVNIGGVSGGTVNASKIVNNTFTGNGINVALNAGSQYTTVQNNWFQTSSIGILMNSNYNIVGDNFFESDVTTRVIDTGVHNALNPTYLAGINYTQTSGVFLGNGNASTTTFQVAHNLRAAPNKAMSVTNGTQTTAILSCTNDDNYIYVTYASAPPSGTNNVIFYWTAERAY